MDYSEKLRAIRVMFDLAKDSEEAKDKALVCRNVVEKTIDLIFDIQKEKKPTSASLYELINNYVVLDYIGNDILIDAMHFVRIVGINALHGKHVKRTEAQVAMDSVENLLNAVNTKVSGIGDTMLYSNLKATVTTDNAIPTDKFSETLPINHLSEAETRKIYIDLYLSEAGWEVVDPQYTTTLKTGKKVKSGTVVPAKACCEIPVHGLPTATGLGFCDYVLYGKNGKPLAIVEAKKASVDASVGLQQVQEYGKCMEQQYGYIPVLYYTNGYEIFVIDGKYPQRKISSFHTINELEYLIQKRSINGIVDMTINTDIAGRPYQTRAITAICERFNKMYRRGLLVMATGTGKTRTAIALVELLTRNNFIKNVLFLADRTSLVRQAFKNFQALLPDMTYCVASDKSLADEPNARITFCTHQTMINFIDSDSKEYSAGRFDLIIIDEAHRSIFNKYGAIFNYFDSLLVGLTATPKNEVDANTYDIFQCETGEPNFAYSLDEAVQDHFLVPPKLVNRTTLMLRDGVKYSELSEEDKAVLALISDEAFSDESIIKSKLFRKVYNTDTCRKVISDLMELGQRVEQGQLIGKTIIFAVNHFHAQMIVDTFNKMYPMYPNYCKLIDNQIKNSEHLIEQFETDPEFRIAVSVDMLDTGIDVPSVLNLVFFKKVNSSIKLAQMVGRGTRLCEGLIDGKNKHFFYIFDYFNNFKDTPKDDVKMQETIVQKLFGLRLDMMFIMQTSEHQLNPEHRSYYQELRQKLVSTVKYIKKNGSERISVRNNLKYVDAFCDDHKWDYISTLEQKELLMFIKPLVESDISEDYLNLSYDLKMLQIEKILIESGNIKSAANIVKAIRLIAQTLLDKATIQDIYDKINDLNVIYSESFWLSCTLTQLEYYRKSLRNLMKYLREEKVTGVIIDHADESTQGEDIDMPFVDIRTYKEKVLDYLMEHSDNPTILKIRNLEKITSEDLVYLQDVLWKELGSENDYRSTTDKDNLAAFIRSIVGIEQEAVNTAFGEYLNSNILNSQQQEFIYSIINYVRENGDIEPEVLVDTSPFDHYSIIDLFGDKAFILGTVLNTLRSSIVC